MTLDYLQTIQTVAIVITLAITVWQLRLSRKAVSLDIYHSTLNKLFDWRSDIINDPSLISDPMAGTADGDIYTTKQYYHRLKLYSIYESIFLMRRDRLVSAATWTAWENNLKISLSRKGDVAIWRRLQKTRVFDSVFVAKVLEVIRHQQEDTKNVV